jgi:ABC-type lipopolysaccharide export system ATPase subunit
MKHLEPTFEIYVYNHCNMYNIIPIYFCNIDVKHLQHISKTSKTLETYACNMRVQHNITLLLERMEAHHCGARRRYGGRRRRMELARAPTEAL